MMDFGDRILVGSSSSGSGLAKPPSPLENGRCSLKNEAIADARRDRSCPVSLPAAPFEDTARKRLAISREPYGFSEVGFRRSRTAAPLKLTGV